MSEALDVSSAAAASTTTATSSAPAQAPFYDGQRVYLWKSSTVLLPDCPIHYGEECDVTDPEIISGKIQVVVMSMDKTIEWYTDELSTEPPPPLPEGFKPDGEVYWIGETQWLRRPKGCRIQYGQQMLIMGYNQKQAQLHVVFHNAGEKTTAWTKNDLELKVTQLSPTPAPPLPGGFAAG